MNPTGQHCHMKDKENLKTLLNWADDKGIDIRWSNGYGYYPDENYITMSNRGTDKNKFYTLLHEIGHYIQGNSRSPHPFTHHDSDKKTLLSMYYNMQEEIDAWERGFKLAKKLKIPIDKKDYDMYASKYIASYIYYWNDALRKNQKKSLN
jgi:antirestriction protein ArdC